MFSLNYSDFQMSSAKKKPILVTCPQCETVVLTKDSQRHQDFCGKSATESEIACVHKGVLRGFNVAMDRPEGFLPPDAVGWEKVSLSNRMNQSNLLFQEHSILINQQTMDSLGLLARQPVRILHADNVFIGIVWPCKELALLKTCVLSSRIPRERMITIEACGKVENVRRLCVYLETPLTPTPALTGFLEAYLTHSYLQYGLSIGLKYLGQQVKVTAKEPIEKSIERMSVEEQRASVVSTAFGFKLQLLNSSESGQKEKVKRNPTDLSSVGGMFAAKQVLEDYVISPIRRKESPCSVLIWGLPGSGKTLLLKELALILSESVTFVGSCDELAELEGNSTGEVVIVDVNEVDKENAKVNKALGALLADEKVRESRSERKN